MRKKASVSSWDQLRRGDLIYKVPRFNICAARGYGEFGHRIKECCERALAIESNDKLENLKLTTDSNGTILSIEGTPANCANLDSNVYKFIGNPLVRRFIVRYATGNSLYWNIVVRDDKPSETVTFNNHEYSVGRSNDLFINDIYSGYTGECFYTYDYKAYKSMLNDVIKEWEHAVRNERREMHSALKKISTIR